MTRTLQGICNYCKHLKSYKRERKGKDWEVYVCNAFPEGIPTEIEVGEWDHRRAHPEDNGLEFELEAKFEEIPNWINYPTEPAQDYFYQLRIEFEGKQESSTDEENE